MTETNYAAFDRHVEAIRGPRHLARKQPIGIEFLRDGPADGHEVEGWRYPPPGTIIVPGSDPALESFGTWRGARYELRTLVWSEVGFEARYDFAPDAPLATDHSRKSPEG